MSHLVSGLAGIRTQSSSQVSVGNRGSCWTGRAYPGSALTTEISVQTGSEHSSWKGYEDFRLDG